MIDNDKDQVAPKQPSMDAVLAEAMRFFQQRHTLDRRELRWSNFRRGMWIAFILLQVGLLIRIFVGPSMPTETSVAVIPLSGPISSDSDASAAKVVPMIEKACRNDRISNIVIEIDSPGGAPNESERIVRAIETCKQDKKKHFTTIIGSTGASAAYMVAIHGDKLVAGRYSVVGSIGAIMRYVDASEAVRKFGLSERVFKSGTLKGGPSMWSGSDAATDSLNQEMVSVLGKDFLSEVVAQRKGKLNAPLDVLGTGRIWTGPQAKELGLVDGIATLEDLKATDFKGKEVNYIRQKSPLAQGFGLSTMLKDAVARALADLQEPAFQ